MAPHDMVLRALVCSLAHWAWFMFVCMRGVCARCRRLCGLWIHIVCKEKYPRKRILFRSLALWLSGSLTLSFTHFAHMHGPCAMSYEHACVHGWMVEWMDVFQRLFAVVVVCVVNSKSYCFHCHFICHGTHTYANKSRMIKTPTHRSARARALAHTYSYIHNGNEQVGTYMRTHNERRLNCLAWTVVHQEAHTYGRTHKARKASTHIHIHIPLTIPNTLEYECMKYWPPRIGTCTVYTAHTIIRPYSIVTIDCVKLSSNIKR